MSNPHRVPLFSLGIRTAFPCYGWRVYLRGVAAPFDTSGGEMPSMIGALRTLKRSPRKAVLA